MTVPAPPLRFVAFMHLLQQNGEFEWFTLSGVEYRFVDYGVGPSGWRVRLRGRSGGLVDIDADKLEGRHFNEWLL